MFLKCFRVMARPATIAGRYIRSRQLSFGRETVTVILKPPTKQAKEHENLGQIIHEISSCDFLCLAGKS
jgi:hypothetical protein